MLESLIKKRIAVILAAHNGAQWITTQLESILDNNNTAISIFISIDFSEDDTEMVCKRFSEQYSNVIIMPNVGKFGGAAPNFFHLLYSVDFAEFNYISFSDQDDIWHPDKLSSAIQILMQNNCDGYSSNVTAFWPDGRKKFIDKAQPQVKWDFLFESAGPGCTFVITQKLALKLQAFIRANKEIMLSVYLHDWFIYAFARSHNYTWYIDQYSSLLYRQHATNQVGVNTGYKAFIHRIYFILSGKAIDQSSLIATLCGLENHAFVKRWHKHSRLSMLYLAFHATKCRRKRSEQLIFFFSCLVLTVFGQKKLCPPS